MKLIINTDGLSKNNPGEAAIGATLKNEMGLNVATISEYIGKATNNVAEYRAVIVALYKAGQLGADEIVLLSDSELMVKQLKGEYKVKNETLKVLHLQASVLLQEFNKVTIDYIPREHNTEADELANAAVRKQRKEAKNKKPGNDSFDPGIPEKKVRPPTMDI